MVKTWNNKCYGCGRPFATRYRIPDSIPGRERICDSCDADRRRGFAELDMKNARHELKGHPRV